MASFLGKFFDNDPDEPLFATDRLTGIERHWQEESANKKCVSLEDAMAIQANFDRIIEELNAQQV